MLQVTNLDKLREKAQGQTVQLPGWDEEPFICKVKRVSMLGLASQGKIPNSLLGAAQKVFTQTVDSKVTLKDICEVMKVIAAETLVEPTVKDIEEAGLELTDEQLAAIMNYSQQGAKALERFRTEPGSTENNKSK